MSGGNLRSDRRDNLSSGRVELREEAGPSEFCAVISESRELFRLIMTELFDGRGLTYVDRRSVNSGRQFRRLLAGRGDSHDGWFFAQPARFGGAIPRRDEKDPWLFELSDAAFDFGN
jgi:hypothetical protein